MSNFRQDLYERFIFFKYLFDLLAQSRQRREGSTGHNEKYFVRKWWFSARRNFFRGDPICIQDHSKCTLSVYRDVLDETWLSRWGNCKVLIFMKWWDFNLRESIMCSHIDSKISWRPICFVWNFAPKRKHNQLYEQAERELSWRFTADVQFQT